MIYDLCIFGGGIAGTTAALKASENGLSVLLLDPDIPGGVCLAKGCIPAKVSLSASTDLPGIAERRNAVIRTLQEGLSLSLSDAGIRHERVFGKLLSKENNLFCVKCGDEIIKSRFVLLACGSRAKVIPGTWTPEDVFSAETLPESVLILGAGAAGLEAASYLRKMGCAVTILEQNSTLLPDAEPEIGSALLRSFRKQGIKLHLGVSASVLSETEIRTENKIFHADKIVCAIGRTVKTDSLGLASVGLSSLTVNEHMETPVPSLYAVGDVLSHHCTAHAAIREAECAVRSMLSKTDCVRYREIPNVVFSNPQCAFVGDTVKSAESRGLSVLSSTVFLKSCGGYLAAGGDGNGVLKMIASTDGTILGLHLCGGNASELSALAVVLVSGKVSVFALSDMVFPHPTVSEAIRTASTRIAERIRHL